MPVSRFYHPEKLSPGAIVTLHENAARHAIKVLRLQAGDTITLFNGDGHDYAAELTLAAREATRAKVTAQVPAAQESPVRVLLAQAISSGDRMDFTLQKAVELGATDIQPLAAERSVVKLSGERADRRREHWQNVVIAACEQSGRAVVPHVAAPLPLLQWLQHPPEHTLRLMLAPNAPQTLHDLESPDRPVCLLIGCEGGFSPEEVMAAEHAGFTPIRLGTRVLRTETAGLAAISAIQTLWGDF